MALCGFKSKANDDLWAKRGSGRNIWERLEWAEFYSLTTPGLFGVRSTEGRCNWASVCQVLKNLQRGKKSWLFFLSIRRWRAKDQGSLLINHLESFHSSWKSNAPLMEYWDTVAKQTDQVYQTIIIVWHPTTDLLPKGQGTNTQLQLFSTGERKLSIHF